MKFLVLYIEYKNYFFLSCNEIPENNSKTCFANLVSIDLFGISKIIYIKSNLVNKAGGKLIFYTTERFGSYFDKIGFAADNIEVLVFSWQTIPALATDIVCCSIAYNKISLLFYYILSN